MSDTYYSQEYFEKRDCLDLHIAEAIKILMKENGLKKVLDVGCGTGKLVEFLKRNGFEAIGCDNSKEAVAISGQIMASATNLPFENESFDLVTAISLIEHLTKNEASDFALEAYRVLKPRGFIFLITPNFASPMRFLKGKDWFGYQDPTHLTFYTPYSLAQLLKKHSFGNFGGWFKKPPNLPFGWPLPRFFSILPKGLLDFLSFLAISTPLALMRDSFWLCAQKKEV